MKIDGKNYDLNKVADSISRNQLVENENLLSGAIFDFIDNLDGKKEGKLSKLDMMSIFHELEIMDNNKKYDELTDNELSVLAHKIGVFPNPKEIKNFIVKLLQVNEDNFKKEEENWNFKRGDKPAEDEFQINSSYKGRI